MPDERALAGSFRDPSGRVFEKDGVVYRSVSHSYKAEYDVLMSSGLYEALTGADLLVAHEEVSGEDSGVRDAYRVLKPERIPFVSYPYEWPFGALKDAALATLDIQLQALDRGMSLKDASAFNIQFLGARPVLIDTLSFETYEAGTPWVAYRQFCQHFLAPLALMSYVDVRLGRLSALHIDGVPLDLAADLLPGRSSLKLGLKLHIHSHAKSMQKHASAGVGTRDMKGRFSEKAFRGLIDNLASTIRSLDWEPRGTTWSDYYAEAAHYSDESRDAKSKVVAAHVEEIGPRLAIDLGANTGVFSRLACDAGAMTIALDIDPAAVEQNYRMMRKNDERNILPLVFDLTNPSPGVGWGNEERLTLEQRGPADLGLALALIHHLTIGNNVPFDRVAAYFRGLCKNLVIEFVPKTDPKVQVLLSSREDIFEDYDEKGFERGFQEHYAIERRTELPGSGRTIYLMRGL